MFKFRKSDKDRFVIFGGDDIFISLEDLLVEIVVFFRVESVFFISVY